MIGALHRGRLRDDDSTFLDDPVREATATARTVDADHGRIETRTVTVSTAIAWLQADYQWPGPPPMSRVLHRTLFADPMLATRGEGISLHTADGRKIIDSSGGAAVACLDHGHPRINAAITEQLSKVAYIHTALFTNQVSEELAETTVDGKHGDHICITPPYVATPSDIDTIVERLGDAVDDAIAGLPKSLCPPPERQM